MRFEQALEKRHDRSLSIFWNELVDTLFEDEYVKELEWTNLSLMMNHSIFMLKVKTNMEFINMAKRTLKQAEAAERQFNGG